MAETQEAKEKSPFSNISTVENVKTQLTPAISADEKTSYEMMRILSNYIHILEETDKESLNYKQLVLVTFHLIKNVCSVDKILREDADFMLLVKALFDRYIRNFGFTELQNTYNLLFTDQIYEETNKYLLPVLSEEWKEQKIKEYQQQHKELLIKKHAKHAPPKYQVDEIIGAKDRESRWWMSRVLAIFTHLQHTVYYVEFLGWGEKFNEFIVDGFRLAKFNPKRHKYFRACKN